MASTQQAHPAFPARNYSSIHNKLPDRNRDGGGGGGGNIFGATGRNPNNEQQRAPAQGGSSAPSNAHLQNITDEQREEINEAFGLFDLDKDQRIDYHEFKVSLKALGFDLPKAHILDLLNTHGIAPSPNPSSANPNIRSQHPKPITSLQTPGRLVLTLQAFQTVAATLISQRDPREEILRAFSLFDTNDKGMITIDDLRKVAKELGEGLDEDELVAMIEEFDLDGKGGVGREEFVGICMG
ncbi:hypothetical protein HYALB_00012541 [Hymenoscyphus albidus]|uniref:EF-hand domain-containing protein n=1 Tax=Hymenoscyphus albidus TaxID=595503 RepID=A0A9N9Q5Z4_9HELO|nr:hypothetical protein HYALB_00012541 [Hymenoscyphus albidus]